MVIGVDLGGTNIRAALIKEGAISTVLQEKLCEKESLQNTIDQLIAIIASLISKEVSAIGIGVPSVVDIEKGIVYDVINIPSWKRVELKKTLVERFQIPVYINNDVNCFALGEQKYGQGKTYSSFVALSIGTGIGAAIIINKQLYTGKNCGAGEIGSLSYLDKNFEFYTSSLFFESKSTTPFLAHQAASDGDQSVLPIWEEFGCHLGNMIKAILYAYDPEVIILGGSIAKAFKYFEAPMKAAISDLQFPETFKSLNILLSNVENIALLGAAALVKKD
jgi:glucokinase